jgi:hypothetical protein
MSWRQSHSIFGRRNTITKRPSLTCSAYNCSDQLGLSSNLCSRL